MKIVATGSDRGIQNAKMFSQGMLYNFYRTSNFGTCSQVTKMVHMLVTVSLSFIYRVLLPKADGG